MSTVYQSGTDAIRLNWKDDIDTERSLPPINWKALEEYAKGVKRRYTNHDSEIICQLSAEYIMGGGHVVRRLDFGDGTSWVARLRWYKVTAESCKRLIHEVHTMHVIRARSKIPVPKVFDYDASCDNVVGVPFMLQEFIPADNAMDAFGGYYVHRGRTPPQFEAKYYASMANIQVEMASVRFPKIGSIVKLSDGTYSVGEIPGIGGPFDTAADFFHAWAKHIKYPYNEAMIRHRTPATLVDAVIKSINDFPSQLSKFAQRHPFQPGPFPIMHTGLWKNHVMVDSEYRIQAVVGWQNAIAAPWEMVEFMKDLSIVPPVMEPYLETEAKREMLAERKRYVHVVRELEEAKQLDSRLSETLDDWNTQNLAHALWLYLDGRIGFYTHVIELLEGRPISSMFSKDI